MNFQEKIKRRKRINSQGYVEVRNGKEWILEHRKVAREILSRELDQFEAIHHINLNKTDNNPDNLALFKNQRDHARFHIKLIKFPYMTNPMRREIEALKISNITNGQKTN